MFEWDEAKRLRVLRERGLDFATQRSCLMAGRSTTSVTAK